jgi:hypothetical protein
MRYPFYYIAEKQHEAFNKIKEKSDDDYEKNIVYIAAGTLVLSMTFLEKIIKVETSSGIWFLITSWGLLAITLLGNLVSHQLSSRFHEICIDLYDKCGELSGEPSDEENATFKENLDFADKKFESCNSTIRTLNWATTLSLFVGILSMVIFCSMNALNAKIQNEIISKNKQDSIMSKQIKPHTQNTDISKGRTMSPSMRPPSQSTNNGTGNGNQGSGSNAGSGNSQSGNK